MKECLFWCKDKEKNRDGQGKAPQSNNYYTFIPPTAFSMPVIRKCIPQTQCRHTLSQEHGDFPKNIIDKLKPDKHQAAFTITNLFSL